MPAVTTALRPPPLARRPPVPVSPLAAALAALARTNRRVLTTTPKEAA